MTTPTGPDDPERPGPVEPPYGSVPPSSDPAGAAGSPPPPPPDPASTYPPPPASPPSEYGSTAYPPPAPPAPAGEYGRDAAPTVGEAVGYGWSAFVKNIGPLVVIALVVILVQAGLSAIGLAFDSYWGRAIFNIITTIVGYIITVALYRAALMILDGRKPVLGELFSGPAVINYFLASLLAGIIVGIGFLLLFIPGIIAAFLLQFTGFAAIDRYQDGPVAALSHSFNVVKSNVGVVILFDLAAIAILIVGALLCGVGLLVAIPVVLIASGYMWRRLSGGQVAAIA